MKRAFLAVAAVSVLALGIAFAGGDEYANCGLCKPMMAEPGLMENVKWDTHEIATGMVTVMKVSDSHMKAWDRAHGKMKANIERLEAGETMELCPYCTGMNKLAKAGAHIEDFKAQGAYLTVITSEKPDVIAQIHKHNRWAKAEHEKHQKMMKEGDHGHGHDHHGHDHDEG